MYRSSVPPAPVTAQEAKCSLKHSPINHQRNRSAFSSSVPTLAQRVKAAAQFDLRLLAEEAGFRLGRGKTYQCIFHRDRTPSAHLYEDRIHCFSCGKSCDAIDLAQLIVGGSAGDAIRWLAVRYNVVRDGSMQPTPRFSEIEYTNAELCRVGLCWAIQNELEELKRPLLGTGVIDGEQIFKLTALFSEARVWSPRQAALFFTKLRSRDPQRVRRWMQDALQCQVELAAVIAYAGTGSARAL
jgi:hypothetical protein